MSDPRARAPAKDLARVPAGLAVGRRKSGFKQHPRALLATVLVVVGVSVPRAFVAAVQEKVISYDRPVYKTAAPPAAGPPPAPPPALSSASGAWPRARSHALAAASRRPATAIHAGRLLT